MLTASTENLFRFAGIKWIRKLMFTINHTAGPFFFFSNSVYFILFLSLLIESEGPAANTSSLLTEGCACLRKLELGVY